MIGVPTTTVQGPRESSDVVLVARSLNAGGLSTPFRDAPAGVMVLFAVVHLDWLDGAAANVYIDSPCFCRLLRGTSLSAMPRASLRFGRFDHRGPSEVFVRRAVR